MEQKEFYTIEEIAKLLDLKEQTIREYIKRGDLVAFRFGKSLRVKKDDLNRFIDEHRIERKDT
jgi:putative molybdopterin biosynthesis protein